jgi:hypothetical protein
METFVNDDRGYQKWIIRNFHGFVLHQASKTSFVLHKAYCDHIDTYDDVITKKPKHCSLKRHELTGYARDISGKQPDQCRSCGS